MITPSHQQNSPQTPVNSTGIKRKVAFSSPNSKGQNVKRRNISPSPTFSADQRSYNAPILSPRCFIDVIVGLCLCVFVCVCVCMCICALFISHYFLLFRVIYVFLKLVN